MNIKQVQALKMLNNLTPAILFETSIVDKYSSKRIPLYCKKPFK